MTVKESIKAQTTYPIPDNTVELFCINRGLESSSDYSLLIGESEGYQLLLADCYHFLATNIDFSEQEVSISIPEKARQEMLSKANTIYGTYGDPKFNGDSFGFIGENWNG